jgi:hypothetical protein
MSPEKLSPSEKRKYSFGIGNADLHPDSHMASTKEQTMTLPPSPVNNLNIFQEVNNTERKKYNDCNAGPKVDAEGTIIKWSIIGKTD